MADETLARELVRSAGLERDVTLAPLRGGTVNQAFRVESPDAGSLILRLAPSDAEVAPGPSWLSSHALRREQQVLRLVAPVLPGLTPETIYFDESRERVDRDWVLQRLMPGRPWSELRATLNAEEDQALWRSLGELIRRVHDLVGDEFGPPEAGYGTATWSDLVRWDVTGFTVDAGRFGFDAAPMEALRAIVDGAVPLLDEVREPRLVHSDLGLNHVFIAPGPDGRHRISGIIDWEYGRFADPLSESVFTGDAGATDDELAAFCEGYGCPPATRPAEARLAIYRLVSLGWYVTDLARRGLTEQIPEALARMEAALEQARALA